VFRPPRFDNVPHGPLIVFRMVGASHPVGIEYTHSLADTVFAVRMWRRTPAPWPYIVFCADNIDEAAIAIEVIGECVPRGALVIKRAAVGHPRWTPPDWLMAAPIRWHASAIV
jgi:hypothetical protein